MYGQSNMNLMQMQNQMGSFGNMGNMFGGASTFFYTGNVIGLQSKLQDFRSQSTPITDIRITVMGNQVKQFNYGCLILTTVSASIVIFPMFFMCCDWWKKMVYPGYSVPMSTYQNLQSVIFSPGVRTLSLTVCDSTFDSVKAKLLYDMLSRSSLKGFDFNNTASINNFNSNQWSDFGVHMKPFKSLPMMTDITWHDQIVL